MANSLFLVFLSRFFLLCNIFLAFIFWLIGSRFGPMGGCAITKAGASIRSTQVGPCVEWLAELVVSESIVLGSATGPVRVKAGASARRAQLCPVDPMVATSNVP